MFTKPSLPVVSKLCGFVLSFILLTACQPKKNEDQEQALAQNKVVDSQKQDQEFIPIAVSFFNGKLVQQKHLEENEEDRVVSNLNITIIDSLGKVTTLDGNNPKSLFVDEGMMALKLSTKVPLPYTFVIKAESPDYITNYYNVKIYEDQPHFFAVYMVNFNEPPLGVYNESRSFTLTGSDNLLFPARIIVNKRPSDLILKLPKKTIFTAGTTKNSLVDKNLAIKMSYAIPSPGSSRTFPNGRFSKNDFSINRPFNVQVQANDKTGYKFKRREAIQEKSQSYLLPYCWLTLEANTKTEKITKFDAQSINAEVTFNADYPNFAALKNGKEIPIWSLGDDGVWKNEGKAILKKTFGNTFTTSFNIAHLSTWALAEVITPCVDELIIPYKCVQEHNLYSELVLMPSGYAFKLVDNGSRIIRFAAGRGNVSIMNTPQNQSMEFVVYDNENDLSTKRGSQKISTGGTCSDVILDTIDLENINVKRRFLVIEQEVGNSSFPICNFPVWFKFCNMCGGQTVRTCRNHSGIFDFGGHVNKEGKVSLTHSSEINWACLRLWYGEKKQSTAFTSEWLNVLVDFRKDPAKVDTIYGVTKTDTILIEHTIDVVKNLHKLKLLKRNTPSPFNSACNL